MLVPYGITKDETSRFTLTLPSPIKGEGHRLGPHRLTAYFHHSDRMPEPRRADTLSLAESGGREGFFA